LGSDRARHDIRAGDSGASDLLWAGIAHDADDVSALTNDGETRLLERSHRIEVVGARYPGQG
jgi:hypothetical protein